MHSKAYHYISFTFIFCALFASHTKAQTFSNEFLAIGIGARAQGLASTQVSIVDDLTAGYWNPAALSKVKSFELSYMHSEYFGGIGKFDYGGIALPLKNAKNPSAIALNVIRFGVDNIPNTINFREADGQFNFDNITEFSATDYGFLLSYGKATKIPGFSLGGTAKVIRRSVGDFANAWGFGIDLGLHWESKEKNWKLGVNARDISSTFNAWTFTFNEQEQQIFDLTNNDVVASSSEITKPTIIIGGSNSFRFGKGKDLFGLTTALDFDITTDGQRNTLISADPISIQPHFGIELDYDNLIFLRTGAGNYQKVVDDIGTGESVTFQPNIGLGLQIGKVALDYAFTDIGDQSNALFSHVFSLTIDLSKINRLKELRKKISGDERPAKIIEQID